LWEDETLFAEEGRDYGHGTAEAEAFMTKLAQLLHVKQKHIMAAYEDAWYYMWRERRLPSNVDPLASNLENKEERDRLAKVFEQGMGKAVGLRAAAEAESRGAPGLDEWPRGFSGPKHLFLIPGDSPSDCACRLIHCRGLRNQITLIFIRTIPSIADCHFLQAD
jgi:uncharacterized protein (DUF2126 family)